MEQKKAKGFKDKLLQKKQQILEAYSKNKAYGKEADADGAQDIADKASNSYTKEFLFSLSNSERDMLQMVDEALERIEDRRFGVCVVLRGRDEHEATGGRALGAPLPRLPGEAGAGPPLTRDRLGAVSDNLAAARDSARSSWIPCWPLIFPGECPACARPSPIPPGDRSATPAGRPAAAPRTDLRAAACPSRGPSSRAGAAGAVFPRFAAGASLGPYEGGLRVLLHELKYRGRRRVAARLAEVLLAGARRPRADRECSVLVPVPLHPRRRRERGFNQAELLAAAIARRTGIASSPRRPRAADGHRAAGGLERGRAPRATCAGAFAVRRRAQVAGRAVVLVDDVVTTGATARGLRAGAPGGGGRARCACSRWPGRSEVHGSMDVRMSRRFGSGESHRPSSGAVIRALVTPRLADAARPGPGRHPGRGRLAPSRACPSRSSLL